MQTVEKTATKLESIGTSFPRGQERAKNDLCMTYSNR